MTNIKVTNMKNTAGKSASVKLQVCFHRVLKMRRGVNLGGLFGIWPLIFWGGFGYFTMVPKLVFFVFNAAPATFAGLKRIGGFSLAIVLYLRARTHRLFPNSRHCGRAKPAAVSHSK